MARNWSISGCTTPRLCTLQRELWTFVSIIQWLAGVNSAHVLNSLGFGPTHDFLQPLRLLFQRISLALVFELLQGGTSIVFLVHSLLVLPFHLSLGGVNGAMFLLTVCGRFQHLPVSMYTVFRG